MSLLYYLPLALATVLLIHTSDAFSILPPPTSVATLMKGATNTLATIGAATSLFGSVSFGKLLLALKHESNFDAAFLSSPPKDAFANKVVWITGASSGIVSLSLCYATGVSSLCFEYVHYLHLTYTYIYYHE